MEKVESEVSMLRLLSSHLRQTFPSRLRCPLPILIIAAVLVVAPVSAVAQESMQSQDSLDILDAWVANRVLSRGVPGLSIGVVVGNKLVWAHGYGYADLEKKIPTTPRTLFGIRSVTKTFTAVAILQLRDAGKLRLSDPVTHYLPQVHVLTHSSNSPEITIRELLTHTSGLRQDPPGTDWTDGTYSSNEDLAHPLLQITGPKTVSTAIPEQWEACDSAASADETDGLFCGLQNPFSRTRRATDS